MSEVDEGDIDIVSIEMTEDARSGSYGSYGEALAWDAHGKSYRMRVQFNSSDIDDLPLFGEQYSVSGTVSAVSEDYATSNWQSGICGTLNINRSAEIGRHDLVGCVIELRKHAISAITSASGNDDAKAVLAALVCGYRVKLYESAVYDSFKVDGLAHLVAVSGSHLALVSMMLGSLLRLLKTSRRLTSIVQTILVVGFLFFAGLPISAIRAAIMTIAALFAFIVKRRASSLNALGLCLLVLVIIDPTTSVSVSFILSALSVLGIVLFSALFKSWLVMPRYPFFRNVGESVAVTMAASILTTPYSACLFNQLPLVSPLANLIAAPLFTIVCGLGVASAFVSAINPVLGVLPLGLAISLCDILCQCVQALASLPYASIPFAGSTSIALVVTSALSLLLWIKWPRLRAVGVCIVAGIALTFALGVLFVAPTTTGVEIVALDVGQGDAILLRDGSSAILVDTGNQDQKLLSALARQGVYHLDAVVITHGDDDHMGSLDALKGVVGVDRVVVCDFARSCTCSNCQALIHKAAALVDASDASVVDSAAGNGSAQSRVVGVSAGSTLSFGAFRIQVIWPSSFTDEGGNADSLCMIATIDVDSDGQTDARAFLCGDAEDDQLDQMIAAGKLGKVDIYKVGHHGSRKAIDYDTACALSPQVALVSVGAGNSYGHPVSTTLDALRSAGATIFRTDQQGDLVCTVTGTSIRVTTQK